MASDDAPTSGSDTSGSDRSGPGSGADRPVSISDLSGPSLLRLARTSRDAARKKLRRLGIDAQVSACLELRPAVRSEFLLLLDSPEEVVPRLPETEFVVTIRAGGMSEGAWLLELATPEQRQGCFDLDCWSRDSLDLDRVWEWSEALVEAGPETIAGTVDQTDPEIWMLLLRAISGVMVLGKEEEAPDGWFTIDGMVHFGPRDDVDAGRVEQIVRALFDGAPVRYWQLVYGVVFESPSEAEEYALRWRAGRLADLGFPEREDAMRVYRPLTPDEAPAVEVRAPGEARAVVPAGSLPRQLDGTRLGEALSRLSGERAADVLYYVLAVANSLAVADRLRLSEEESIPKALEKAVRGIDAGLGVLAEQRSQSVETVLDQTLPLDLFRIGVTSDPDLKA